MCKNSKFNRQNRVAVVVIADSFPRGIKRRIFFHNGLFQISNPKVNSKTCILHLNYASFEWINNLDGNYLENKNKNKIGDH